MSQSKYPWKANSNKTVFVADKEGTRIEAEKLGSGQFEVSATTVARKVDMRQIGTATKPIQLFSASLSGRDIAANAESIDEAADKAITRLDTATAAMKKAGLL